MLLVKSGKGERGTAAATEAVAERGANGIVPSIKCSNERERNYETVEAHKIFRVKRIYKCG